MTEISMKIKSIIFLIIFGLSASCSDYEKVSEDRFIGTWKLQGRSMFEGIKIKIEKTSDNNFIGRVIELNDDKLVNMFVDINDVWVSSIKRSSHFQFKLTEKRIGRQLFSLYDLGTSDTYKVEFIDEDTFGLSEGSSDPLNSDVIYKRMN